MNSVAVLAIVCMMILLGGGGFGIYMLIRQRTRQAEDDRAAEQLAQIQMVPVQTAVQQLAITQQPTAPISVTPQPPQPVQTVAAPQQPSAPVQTVPAQMVQRAPVQPVEAKTLLSTTPIKSTTIASMSSTTKPKKTKKTKTKKTKPISVVSSAPVVSAPITGDVSSFTWASLPPPSQNDKNWCHTWMSDPNDDGSCFALMYHHCLDGYKDESKIPPAVRNVKSSVFKQTYALGGGTYTDKKSKKTWTKFPTPPSQWSSVCVARQDLAGKGKCSKVTKDEWRYWIMANDPNRKSECQKESSLYVKSHVRSAKVQNCCVGNHGHG